MMNRWKLLWLPMGFINPVVALELSYSSITAETLWEYQVADHHLEPGLLRFIAQGEVALTDALKAKAIVSPCLGSYSADGFQCASSRLLEELTIAGSDADMDFVVGRQIVTQGNTEGFIVLDRFNGRDMCRFLRLDIQNKLPNWLAKGRVSWDDNTVAITLAPFSATSTIPNPDGYCNDAFHDLGRFAELTDPGNDSITDWAGGVEWALNRDSWSTTVNVMSTKEDLFVLEMVPQLLKTRPRTSWLGGTVSTTLGDVVLRGEVAFAPARDFTIAGAAVAELLRHSIPTSGVMERWNVISVIGAELQHDDWYAALQYYDDRVEGGVPLVRDQVAHLASLRMRRTFYNEQAILNSFIIVDMDYRDLALRTAISYEFTANTLGEVGYTWYADFGNNGGLFGSYAGRESLFMNLKATF